MLKCIKISNKNSWRNKIQERCICVRLILSSHVVNFFVWRDHLTQLMIDEEVLRILCSSSQGQPAFQHRRTSLLTHNFHFLLFVASLCSCVANRHGGAPVLKMGGHC
jgi:hypothetical protein